MKARDVMVSPVITARPNDTVKQVAQILLEANRSRTPRDTRTEA